MLKKLSIQSKTTLMLLVVSVSSILVIAGIGYTSGRNALQRSIFNQLTNIRAAKSQEIALLNQRANNHIHLLSQDPTIIAAAQALRQNYRDLAQQPVPEEWTQAIQKYYEESFIPKLAVNAKGTPEAETYQPAQPQERYLQYHYTIKSPDFDKKAKINDPGDGSDYSQTHRQYQAFLYEYADVLGLEDIFLIDPDTGDVIYTVYKGIDFATNLKTGPLAESVLAKAFRQVITEGENKYVAFIDYEPYRPSHNDPASILATPVFKDGELIAILAIQASSQELNQIMTHNTQWEKVGLGKTGETYLVGPDYLMRSDSRFLREYPKDYFKQLKDLGVPTAQIERIRQLDSTILTQEVKTEAVEEALQGNSGTRIITDYRGVSVLSAYAPLPGNRQWTILAEIDEAEAFAPIQAFQKWVLITTAVIVVLITLAAMLLSHLFVRPIQILSQGFRKFSQGETDVQVTINSRDEFQALAQAFNEMVQRLNENNQQLQETNQENEQLLLSILPGPVAQRLKGGDQQIADSFPNVTVLFADLAGFTDLAEQVSADELVTILNDLVSAFDEAAERHGVEKIKTIGSGYMAVCGLSVPRLDHAKRMVDFGTEVIQIVQRFNHTRQTNFQTRVGINSGPVVAGIVGRSKFIYDLWGDTVNIAHHMQANGQGDAIQVSAEVYNRLKDSYTFRAKNGSDAAHGNHDATWLIEV